jgi:hypothetical protein
MRHQTLDTNVCGSFLSQARRANGSGKRTEKDRKKSSADKRNFFATMSADVIKLVKQAALEDDTNASEILEKAAKEWLDRRKKKWVFGNVASGAWRISVCVLSWGSDGRMDHVFGITTTEISRRPGTKVYFVTSVTHREWSDRRSGKARIVEAADAGQAPALPHLRGLPDPHECLP